MPLGSMADENGNLKIQSAAQLLKDEKAKEQADTLNRLKERAARDLKHAKEKRASAQRKDKAKKTAAKKETAAAEKANEKREQEFAGIAMAAGTALFAGLHKSRTSRRQKRLLLLILAVVVIAGVIGVVFFRPQLANLLGISRPDISIPDTLSGFLPDEELGFNKIDFENAILGKAREKQELVVMEQDVQVDNQITHALGNISLFKKTKNIHSYGTGVYTVDMSGIDKKHIAVDEDAQTVTVTIPHTMLQYVNVDIAKTEFEETEKAIFGFGDIKLTQEEQQILSESTYNSMLESLDQPAMYQTADEIALLKVREIFQPLITAVSEEFLVEIVLDDTVPSKAICVSAGSEASSLAASGSSGSASADVSVHSTAALKGAA